MYPCTYLYVTTYVDHGGKKICGNGYRIYDSVCHVRSVHATYCFYVARGYKGSFFFGTCKCGYRSLYFCTRAVDYIIVLMQLPMSLTVLSTNEPTRIGYPASSLLDPPPLYNPYHPPHPPRICTQPLHRCFFQRHTNLPVCASCCR